MKVVCFTGYSGAGKTTLMTQVISLLRARGQTVSVLKHAHAGFDLDRPGKDSWRHREAGATEVLIASRHRLALLREIRQSDFADASDPHALLAELDARVDWILVEGFRHSDLPKVEVWRDVLRDPPHLDAHVLALVTDAAARLPQPVALPVLDINQPQAVLEWLLAQGARLAYTPPLNPLCP
jgi:molybdopterin-guanine dinucleotide biosynthesis protein B